MRVPQVNERVKEAPASALRAMFAGIGSLLSVTDKIRAKPAAETPAAPEAATPEAATPETVTPETATPETATPEATVAPEVSTGPEATAVAETSAAPETSAEPEETAPVTAAAPASAQAAALPLANYDELSIASLRARLRNLSADQLTVLISYEKSHANRADVILMFERRIVKLAEG